MKITKREDLDTEIWNRDVERSPFGQIYQLSWFLDAVCDSWFIMEDASVGRWAMPMTTKAMQKVIYQPFFCRQINPVAFPNGFDFEAFIKQLNRIARTWQFCTNEDIASKFPPSYRLSRVYQILNLESPYEEICGRYQDNAKRLLRKASAQTFQILPIEKDTFLEFFMRHTHAKIKDMTVGHLDTLKKLITAAEERDKSILLGVYFDQKLLACGFYIDHLSSLHYIKGSVNAEGQKLGAMYVLMDHLIKSFSEKRRHLDFGGSSIPNIAAFFKKFGAHDVSYTMLSKPDGILISLGKRIYKRLKPYGS